LSQSVNRVILIGRLGKDPEIKYTPSGVALAKFSLATDESYNDAEGNLQNQTEWHNIVVWKKQAEIAVQYLKKGTLVFLEGRIKTRSWDDPQGGKKYMTEIIASRFVMLSSKSEGVENLKPLPVVPTQPPAPEEEEDLPF
jgi:single-strand DNA-binding protein